MRHDPPDLSIVETFSDLKTASRLIEKEIEELNAFSVDVEHTVVIYAGGHMIKFSDLSEAHIIFAKEPKNC